MKLSKKSLEIIRQLFAENSNLTLPAGLAGNVLEIRAWSENELKLQESTEENLT